MNHDMIVATARHAGMFAPDGMTEREAAARAASDVENLLGQSLVSWQVRVAQTVYLTTWSNREADRRLHAQGHLTERELDEIRRDSMRGLDCRR